MPVELRRDSDLILTAGLGLLACRYFTGDIVFAIAGIAVLTAAALLNHHAIREMVTRNKIVAGLFALVLAMSLVNAEWTAFRSLYYVGVGGLLIMSGYLLSLSGRALQVAGSLLGLFYALLLLSAPFRGILPDDFNNYFPSSSRNGISANLIFIQIFYSAAYYARHRRAPWLTPLVTFAICVLLYGRSGTMVSAGIVAVTCLQNFRHMPARSTASAAVTAAVMSVLIFAPYLPAQIAGIDASTYAQDHELAEVAVVHYGTTMTGDVDLPSLSEFRMGLYTVRLKLLSAYAAGITPAEVITGRPLTDVPLMRHYGFNPHNSFIRGHAYFGLPYLLLLVAFGLSALRGAIHQRQFLVLSLMALFAGRAFFDAFALFDIFDVGFFYCYFLLKLPCDAVAGGYNGKAGIVVAPLQRSFLGHGVPSSAASLASIASLRWRSAAIIRAQSSS